MALLLAGAAQAQGQKPLLAGPAACKFMPPAGFPATGLNWSGYCGNGLAQGSGILRAYAGGRVVRSFFGTFGDGAPLLGVVEVLDEGFIAGRFDAGGRAESGKDDGDRNTLIQAFDVASQAARELATRYRNTGQPASASYYEAKAAELARQLN